MKLLALIRSSLTDRVCLRDSRLRYSGDVRGETHDYVRQVTGQTEERIEIFTLKESIVIFGVNLRQRPNN